ncbi:hypothetical protein TWF481_002840 [Arthrobotrys musiformis]|uniref:C2H2-type domain-containing protein n=1 Tax=Arthrobotrys musiformis TaxID=47236 RepID=A0AAV9VTI7_9PEZI
MEAAEGAVEANEGFWVANDAYFGDGGESDGDDDEEEGYYGRAAEEDFGEEKDRDGEGLTCKACGLKFESRNRLHAHVKEQRHQVAADVRGETVIPSTSGAAINLIPSMSSIKIPNQISDNQYLEIRTAFEPGGRRYPCCADTGFGNSLVGGDFLNEVVRKVIPVVLGKYDTGIAVEGFGGGGERLKSLGGVPDFLENGER